MIYQIHQCLFEFNFKLLTFYKEFFSIAWVLSCLDKFYTCIVTLEITLPAFPIYSLVYFHFACNLLPFMTFVVIFHIFRLFFHVYSFLNSMVQKNLCTMLSNLLHYTKIFMFHTMYRTCIKLKHGTLGKHF